MLVLASDPVLPVTSAVELFDAAADVDDGDDVVDGRLNVTCLTAFLPYTA